LRETPAMIAWDNLPRGSCISCPVIEKSLTSPTIKDRILGGSTTSVVPATTIQFFTGNSLEPAGEMLSRSFVIQIEVDRPDPENREFRHSDPIGWTLQHRAVILRSLYSLLVWNRDMRISAGERSQDKTRFKRWWRLCAEPLERVAGVNFEAILRAREAEDPEQSALATLLRVLQEHFSDAWFTAGDLANLADPSGFQTADTASGSESVRVLLEQATGKEFPPGAIKAAKIGKMLQIFGTRPVMSEDRILSLERLRNAKEGNKYRVKERLG
jgi:hypothetical protein